MRRREHPLDSVGVTEVCHVGLGDVRVLGGVEESVVQVQHQAEASPAYQLGLLPLPQGRCPLRREFQGL